MIFYWIFVAKSAIVAGSLHLQSYFKGIKLHRLELLDLTGEST